jgi:hypothetical protein
VNKRHQHYFRGVVVVGNTVFDQGQVNARYIVARRRWAREVFQKAHNIPAQKTHNAASKGRQSWNRVTRPPLVQTRESVQWVAGNTAAKYFLSAHPEVTPLSYATGGNEGAVHTNAQERIPGPFATLISRLQKEGPWAARKLPQ